MSIALGAAANVENKAESIVNPLALAECFDYTYTFDPSGVVTGFVTFAIATDTVSYDLTVTPGDDETRIGTYYVDLHVCYTDFPHSCAAV